MKVLLWIIGLPALAAITFFAVGPERVWQGLTGPADMGALALDSVERSDSPNDALLGPEAALQLPPDAQTPIFAVSAAELYDQIIEQIDASEGVTWVQQDSDRLYARAVTYSPIMRFPDTNHIWVLPVDETHAALVLYAAAKLGHSDLGKNRERLNRWLNLLADIPQLPS